MRYSNDHRPGVAGQHLDLTQADGCLRQPRNEAGFRQARDLKHSVAALLLLVHRPGG